MWDEQAIPSFSHWAQLLVPFRITTHRTIIMTHVKSRPRLHIYLGWVIWFMFSCVLTSLSCPSCLSSSFELTGHCLQSWYGSAALHVLFVLFAHWNSRSHPIAEPLPPNISILEGTWISTRVSTQQYCQESKISSSFHAQNLIVKQLLMICKGEGLIARNEHGHFMPTKPITASL